MAKKEKKVLGLLPRSVSTTLLLGLVVAFVLALAWSWVMREGWLEGNETLVIGEWLLLAILIGLAVGLVANNAKASTLWIAAGLNALAMTLTVSFITSGYYNNAVDASILNALRGSALPGGVDQVFGDFPGALTMPTAGAVILGIIAAAAAAIGAGTKDRLMM